MFYGAVVRISCLSNAGCVLHVSLSTDHGSNTEVLRRCGTL